MNRLRDYGLPVAFAVLFIASAVWQPDVFLQPENLRNLINQNVAVGLIAVGMTLVVASGGIDLSVGSGLALAAGLSLTLLNRMALGGSAEGAAVWAAAGACVGIGTGLGLVNGFVVAYGRVAPFIGTLVGLVAFRSLVLALAEGGEIRSASASVFPALGQGGIAIPFLSVGQGRPLVLTWGIIAFMACAAAADFVLRRTALGRHIVAVGASERAARYSAVDVRRTKLAAYGILGAFTGLAALFLSARMNSVASSTMGSFFELDAIAAVVIGGTSLRGGRGRVWGTVLGVLLLGVITNMLVVAGVSVYWQGVVKGAIILLAVLIQRSDG